MHWRRLGRIDHPGLAEQEPNLAAQPFPNPNMTEIGGQSLNRDRASVFAHDIGGLTVTCVAVIAQPSAWLYRELPSAQHAAQRLRASHRQPARLFHGVVETAIVGGRLTRRFC